MASVCSVCKHPERKAIDSAIAQRVSQRIIAARHGLTQPSIHRHSLHLGNALTAQDRESALTARGIITKALVQLQELSDQCVKTSPRDWLLVIDRLGRLSEVYAKITGEISTAPLTIINQLGVSMPEAQRAVKAYQASVVDPLELETRALEFLGLRGYSCHKEVGHAEEVVALDAGGSLDAAGLLLS